ncbi:MAG: lipid-A-disaccharide synthase, partial [Bacteroidales bacterium]|nr:lipid-A-disaccharide synthase [Bacteroidales bacterium]
IANHEQNAVSRDRLSEELSPDGRPLVALLPGSRFQEVKVMLPVMLSMSREFPEYRFVVGEAGSLPVEIYDELCLGYDVGRIRARTYDLLSVAYAAAVTSGTASLEAALFGVPLVIGYKAGYLSYHIARRIVKIRYIGLANLIMDKPVLKELIQGEYSTRNLIREMQRLLNDQEYRQRILRNLDELRECLGGPGASERAAHLIYDHLTDNSHSDALP